MTTTIVTIDDNDDSYFPRRRLGNKDLTMGKRTLEAFSSFRWKDLPACGESGCFHGSKTLFRTLM